MNNLEKLGRLTQYFASCDYDHNSNSVEIRSADNGFSIDIEFDVYNESQLEVDKNFKQSDGDFRIEWDGNGHQLNAFTWDFEKLDALLTIIFTSVIKTDIASLPLDTQKNSQLFFNPNNVE